MKSGNLEKMIRTAEMEQWMMDCIVPYTVPLAHYKAALFDWGPRKTMLSALKIIRIYATAVRKFARIRVSRTTGQSSIQVVISHTHLHQLG